VENVVNPPQIPTINNNLRSAVKKALFADIPVKKPIRKLPRMLTASVPTGMARKLK
jgi:hypothetical protein